MSEQDRLDLLRRALDQTHGLIAAVGPGQRDAPTPCGDWDVTELVGHVVHGLDNFTAAARGEKPDWAGSRPAVGEHALEFGRAMLTPQWRGAGGNNAFGDEVAVPADAPVYDRLAGWFGRDPSRWRR